MLSIKVAGIVALDDMQLLVFFENNIVKKFDVKPIIRDYPEFEALKDPDLFRSVQVEPGGYGISWNEELDCSEGELWENGILVPLSVEDFLNFAKSNMINTGEAMELLSCTRQNIEDLVKRGKIHPVKSYPKGRLFMKWEIEKRSW